MAVALPNVAYSVCINIPLDGGFFLSEKKAIVHAKETKKYYTLQTVWKKKSAALYHQDQILLW